MLSHTHLFSEESVKRERVDEKAHGAHGSDAHALDEEAADLHPIIPLRLVLRKRKL